MLSPWFQQHHDPLAFLYTLLCADEIRYPTPKKEVYSIIETIETVTSYVPTTIIFELFTVHNNLVYLFKSKTLISKLLQTILRNILRRAVRLSAYSYIFVHKLGTVIVSADILNCWTALSVVSRLVSVQIMPSSSAEDFICS